MKSINKIRIIIFIVLTIGLTWGLDAIVLRYLHEETDWNVVQQSRFAIILALLIPGIAAIMVKLITREKRGWNKQYFKIRGYLRYYSISWVLVVILTGIGNFFFYLLFQDNFDPNLTKLQEAYIQAGVETSRIQLEGILMQELIISLFISPILYFPICLLGEYGWRGYLFPKLHDMVGGRLAAILVGFVWGLTSVPMMFSGNGYGRYFYEKPLLGITLMTLFCMAFSIILSYFYLKVENCMAPTLSVAMLQVFMSSGIYFYKGDFNPYLGPISIGLISAIPYYVLAIILLFRIKNKKKTPL